MVITRKIAKDLARDGLTLRNDLIRNAKQAKIGIICEGTTLYVCDEEEFMYATMPIALLDVRYDGTIKAIEEKIYALNRGNLWVNCKIRLCKKGR